MNMNVFLSLAGCALMRASHRSNWEWIYRCESILGGREGAGARGDRILIEAYNVELKKGK